MVSSDTQARGGAAACGPLASGLIAAAHRRDRVRAAIEEVRVQAGVLTSNLATALKDNRRRRSEQEQCDRMQLKPGSFAPYQRELRRGCFAPQDTLRLAFLSARRLPAGGLRLECSEQTVGGVAVEAVAVLVVAAGGARIGVASSVLDVAQRGAFIE